MPGVDHKLLVLSHALGGRESLTIEVPAPNPTVLPPCRLTAIPSARLPARPLRRHIPNLHRRGPANPGCEDIEPSADLGQLTRVQVD